MFYRCTAWTYARMQAAPGCPANVPLFGDIHAPDRRRPGPVSGPLYPQVYSLASLLEHQDSRNFCTVGTAPCTELPRHPPPVRSMASTQKMGIKHLLQQGDMTMSGLTYSSINEERQFTDPPTVYSVYSLASVSSSIQRCLMLPIRPDMGRVIPPRTAPLPASVMISPRFDWKAAGVPQNLIFGPFQ